MPLNTLRLNHAPSSHPNDRIVFIKPLPRPISQSQDYETADLILRAIAAQCLPIMKKHYLSVTTLEEYEPNPEFIGRNFNNGEVIQLVLQSQGARRWLSIPTIQMVMMHELAHNMHMNHGRDFWKTRNMFAAEMKELWGRGYTGDGLWGSGRLLGQLEDGLRGRMAAVGSQGLKDLPVCGGTFRSRGGRGRRKKKRKLKREGGDELTWREKKERRIEKKFGKNGVALGEDEDKRLNLEITGKGPMGVKPRVAQSKRGRELRAAAALARFATNKKEVETLDEIKQEDATSEDDSTEYEEGDDGEDDQDRDQEDAKDVNGERLLDEKGHGMVKVCGDEDGNDIHVKQEMDELDGLDWNMFRQADAVENKRDSNDTIAKHPFQFPPEPTSIKPSIPDQNQSQRQKQKQKPKPQERVQEKEKTKPSMTSDNTTSHPQQRTVKDTNPNSNSNTIPQTPHAQPQSTQPTPCPLCTTLNPPMTITCPTCAHVLDPRKDPHCWQCSNPDCPSWSQHPQTHPTQSQIDGRPLRTPYINAGDCGVCGICGVGRDRNSGKS